MSKKDYQAIARAIHEARGHVYTDQQTAVSIIVDAIAGVMAADNPAFDRARFIEACETGATRGMRKAG